jgi:hypothetical protein
MYGSLFQGEGDGYVKERRPKKVGQGKKRIDKPEIGQSDVRKGSRKEAIVLMR